MPPTTIPIGDLTAQAPVVMPPQFDLRAPEKKAPSAVWHQSQRPLPYFAHQNLDPDYFPADINWVIGDARVFEEAEENEAPLWSDEESEALADLESDADISTKWELKARRKPRPQKQPANSAEIKTMKIRGGRPAVAKKVSADLDSDDEMIVRMKEARFLEKDIAQTLIDQGRTAYNPKTIGTRWRRLKVALQKRQDDLLDADLTDWHEGDDDVLLEAMSHADKEVKRLVDQVEAQKWRLVADHMKRLKPVINFSQNACRDRFTALEAGTAKPTPESLPNPTPDIVARIISRREKEEKIRRDTRFQEHKDTARLQENLQGNGWTSKMRPYY